MTEQITAVALISGGLDSMLAARIVQDHNITVQGVHFATGFCTVQRRRRIARPSQVDDPRLRNEALQSAAQIQIPIEILDVAEAYLPVVLQPKHGYGSHMNPCQDCRAFMLNQANAYRISIGAHFLVTGEVVGQRPNSQKRHLIRQIEKETGLTGLILRPLSAKLLPPTLAERKGWIDRDSLYDISGRGRKRQIELAHQFGIEEYAQPAGGCCMLVEQSFSNRLQDFIKHNPPEALDTQAVALLSVGRHLRLDDGTKVIVGRHEGENNFLDRSRRPEQWRFQATSSLSPVALVEGPLTADQVATVASIVATYSQHRREPSVEIAVDDGSSASVVHAAVMEQSKLRNMNVGAAGHSYQRQ